MAETKLASKVVHELRYGGYECFVLNVAGGQFQMPGVPDILLISKGKHIFIEFKGPDTVIKKNQILVAKQLVEAGGKVFLVRFLEPDKWIINHRIWIEGTFKELVQKMFMEVMK